MMLEGPSNRIMIDQSTVTVIVLTIPNQCQHAFTYTFTVELGLEDIGGINRGQPPSHPWTKQHQQDNKGVTKGKAASVRIRTQTTLS